MWSKGTVITHAVLWIGATCGLSISLGVLPNTNVKTTAHRDPKELLYYLS